LTRYVNYRLALAILWTFVLSACASAASGPALDRIADEPVLLAQFTPGAGACHVRTPQDTAVVDTHLHMRPMGGAPLPFPEMVSNLKRAGVAFANVYGIGQSVPVDSPCEYYLDCPGTPVLPALKNDFANAKDIMERKPRDIVLTLSMTFPDLAKPESIPEGMAVLDREFPGMFRWMGEANVVKKALVPNGHEPVSAETVARWAPFMKILRERKMPLALHMDLGDNASPTENLPLMEEILRLYPENLIVWMHMGLSRELTAADPAQHTALLARLLDANPNLSMDISWRVLQDAYFSKPEARARYVALLNRYPTRFLPGTDFVAAHTKSFEIYRDELNATSDILHDVDNVAFRDIALGQNYFNLLDLPYAAPAICAAGESAR
jgi:hypothetical protein